MLNQDVYVPIPVTGLQAVEDIAEILTKIVFNERTGFKFQGAEVAYSAQFGGQMQFHEVAGNVRL